MCAADGSSCDGAEARSWAPWESVKTGRTTAQGWRRDRQRRASGRETLERSGAEHEASAGETLRSLVQVKREAGGGWDGAVIGAAMGLV